LPPQTYKNNFNCVKNGTKNILIALPPQTYKNN
jgi:hypothetical protein